MTREEAIKRLRELQAPTTDQEIGHSEADKVLCRLLDALGFADVVAEWDKVAKWYA
jgi:hypothetical protein